MMKLQGNFYKVIIIVSLLIFWAYLLFPIVSEVEIRPDFSQILSLGPTITRGIKYLQIFLIALLALLVAIIILKGCEFYFFRRQLIKENKWMRRQIKKYKHANQQLASFEDAIADPFNIDLSSGPKRENE